MKINYRFSESVDICDFEETDMELVDDKVVADPESADKATDENRATPAKVNVFSGFLEIVILIYLKTIDFW